MRMFKGYIRIWPAFRRSEDGNATIEFCIFVPLFILLFTMAFEFGLWQTRQVLLDHGLDQTVRQVRLGMIEDPDHDTLIKAVCNHAGLIADCDNQVRLQMYAADVADLKNQVSTLGFECRDRSEPDSEPLTDFINTGENNQLMFLRACALFDPFLPSFGVGARISLQEGYYAVVATSSYVMEPYQ